MKTIISRLCCLLSLTALMASCNLFIDDELEDDDEFKNVPVHTGEGYDAPVKVHDGGCDVEYQFNSDVRVVEAETQDAYITDIQSDEDNMNLIVSFRADTPKELLPKAGEIFLTIPTDKFPMGANHRVLECEKEGNGYQCVMTFATLRDTFKELHINGSVDFGKDSFEVAAPPYEEEVAAARTRADDQDISSVSANVECDGNHIDFTLPFSMSLNYLHPKGFHAELTADKSKNFYKVSNEFRFENFSLDNMKADFVQTVEERFNLVASGGFTKSKQINKNPLYILRNKPVTIGYVVLVFWISADLYFDMDVTGGLTISKHKKYQNIYHLDMYEQKVTKDTKVLIDQDWQLDASIEGSFGLRLEFTFGMGIYGKVLSVRIIPTLRATVTLKIPIVSHESGQVLFDISNAAGLTFTIDLSGKFGVFLDLSLKNLFGSNKPMNNKELIDKVKKGDPEAKKKFDELANQASNNDHISEKAAFVNLGPWPLFTSSFSWYPKIEDKSFKIIRSWNEDTKEMSFSAEFKLNKLGFWVTMGKQFTPALMIKKGKKYVYTIFPTEGGMDAKCSKDKTYTFEIPTDQNENDIMYTAYPCFYPRPVTYSYPEAFDKGLPYCNTSPNVVITDVLPTDLKVKWLAENGVGEFVEDDFYDWEYDYDVKTFTSIKGMANIDSWYLKEICTNTKHKFKSSKDEKKDGIYIMYWTFTEYRKFNKRFALALSFHPMFTVKDGKSASGPFYDMRIWSDRTYEVTEDSYGSSYNDSFSRMRGDNLDDDDDKSAVKTQLNAIEYDGEIIWERPGSHFEKPSTTIPFKKL